MSAEIPSGIDSRSLMAIEELKGIVRERYPTATFEIARLEDDPTAWQLITTVDIENPHDVMDIVVDRVLTMQIEENIPVHVIPIRPLERVLEELNQRRKAG